MKKRRRRSIPTIVHAGISIREVRPGYFMVDMRRGGTPERICFRDLNTAKTHCELKARKIQNEGTSALSLTPDQRSDASKAIKELAEKATLLDAAKFWMKHNSTAGCTINELCDAWMKYIENKQCRATTLRERTQKTNRFSKDFGDMPACAMTAGMVQEWFDNLGLTGNTRDGYRRCLHAMYKFAVTHKPRPLVEHNPIADIEKIKLDETMPRPFTADAAEAIMRAAAATAPIIVPTLAVQFFAGLRPGEALGLQWEDINFDEQIIRILPGTSKVRTARVIEHLPDTWVKWLLPYRQTSGAIGITTVHQWAHYMVRRKIIEQAGVQWIQDGPRKTFATMHMATHQDAAKTAAVMGHVNGADILYKHYRGLATTKEAARYWKIMPEATAGKVIKFKTA